MKGFCKRGLCFALTLILGAGLLPVLGGGAAAASLEERQQAVVAAALAYFDKGHSVQYDGKAINSIVHRFDGGKTRSTNNASPEFATPQETMYTVCSDFTHQVYWEAFRFDLLGRGAGYVATATLSNVRPPAPVDPADPGYADYLIRKRNADMLVWYRDPGGTAAQAAADVEQMFELAQPGDVFAAYAMKKDANGDYTVDVGGHAMIWAGDVDGDGSPDIIHSGGRHMNMDDRIDKREYLNENDPDYIADRNYYSPDDPDYYRDHCANFGETTNGGSIRIADAREYIRGRYNKVNRRLALLRPALIMTDETYPLRPASQYRVTHPGLAIDRMLSKTRFQSAYPGETVTMTLKLSNNSPRHSGFGTDDPDFNDESDGANAQAGLQSLSAAAGAGAFLQSEGQSYTVTVAETAPAGARIKTPFAGAAVEGDTMTLDVPLTPGETRTLTAEFEITANCGETVVFDGGSVGDIPSNSIPITVGGLKLTAAEKTKLSKIAEHLYNRFLNDAGANNATLAEVVYRQILGWDIQLPDFAQIYRNLTKPAQSPSGKQPRVFLKEDEVAAEDMTAYKMMVRNCWGGISMWNLFGPDRCSDPRDMHLEPGDVIVRSDSTTNLTQSEQLVYLGNGKYLCYDKETNSYPIVNEREFFRCLFYKVFYVLRPSLVYGKVPGRAKITIEGGSARPTETAAVTLRLEENTGVAGALLRLHYDPALRLQSMETGAALPELHFTPPGDLSANPVGLLWDGMEADSSTGTLLTVTFEIPAGTKAGSYEVSLSCEPGGVYDGNTEDVFLLAGSSRIEVLNPAVGDCNGDGVINAKDVTLLRRGIAGGYDLDIATVTGDCNGDGVINAKDVTVLRRFLAGGYGVELHQPTP